MAVLMELMRIVEDFRHDRLQGGCLWNTLFRKLVMSTYFKIYELWALRPFFRSGLTLNVGAGTDKLGNDVISVDITNTEDNWLGAVPSPDVVADMHALPFRAMCFRTVVMMHVLEHSRTPDAALLEAWRVVEKDGVICGCQPNFYRRNFVAYYHRNKTHFQRWTDLDFVSWLSSNGILRLCSLVQFRRMSYLLNPFSFDWALVKK